MDLANAKLVVNTTQKLDVLSKRLYIQSKSFDEVIDLCKNHDEMLKCIPAIQPISNKDSKTASGYGTRIDPIYVRRSSIPVWTSRLIRGQMYMLPEMERS